jgi:predicted nucleic acid-binding protein
VDHLAALAADGDEIVVPCHALAEAYAVLTRLPPPNRLSTSDAFAVLEGSWRNREAAALDAGAYWSVLESAAAEEIHGGSLYDALIVAAARQAGATVILTWNTAHFQRVAGQDLRVDMPPSPRAGT